MKPNRCSRFLLQQQAPWLNIRRFGVCCLGMLLATTAVIAAELEDAPVTFKGSAITVPKSYGRLVSVVETNQIHYLYFEDDDGAIRVLLVSNKGTNLRASQALEMLSPNAYLIPRSPGSSIQERTTDAYTTKQ